MADTETGPYGPYDPRPGAYASNDPGGGPYNPETGTRDWYHPSAGQMFADMTGKLRRRAGLTQAELAEKITAGGITMYDSTVAKIETNKRRVTLDEAEVISRVLGVDISYMTGIDYPPDLKRWLEEEHQRKLNPRRRP